MRYSIYTKKISNIKDELEKEWLSLGNNLTQDAVICILDSISEDDKNEDYTYVVLPDIYLNDIVLNKKTNEYGLVIHMQKNSKSTDFVTVQIVEKVDGINFRTKDTIYTWRIKDLIVMN